MMAIAEAISAESGPSCWAYCSVDLLVPRPGNRSTLSGHGVR